MRRFEGGFAVPEFVAGTALLLLPVGVLVAMLPVWSEAQTAGRVAAQQAARAAVLELTAPAAGLAAQRAAEQAAADHGHRLAGPVVLEGEVAVGPGGVQSLVTARVTMALPALRLPLVGEVGTVAWTTSSTQPVDVYRSRP